MPGPVQAFERRGAIAQIYMHPGQHSRGDLHVDLGRADTGALGRKPNVPVVCINRPDGEALARRRAARHRSRDDAHVAA